MLRNLQSDKFHPDSVSLRDLTLKSLFLGALAAVCCRSELHTLEHCSLVFQPASRGCAVKPHPRFKRKTHMTTKGVASLCSVVILVLPSEQSDVVSICPVRTLRLIVDQTDVSRSPDQIALFLSFDLSIVRDISLPLDGLEVHKTHSRR